MHAQSRYRAPFDELHQAVERTLSQHFESDCRINRLRRRVSPYSSSSTIENIWVDLENRPQMQLVLKDLSPRSGLHTAQQVRPHFIYDPLREIETYQSVLLPEQFGTPVFYGSVHSADTERYWLFLERVTGPLLWQMGRLETWKQSAQWLARLHSLTDISGSPQHQPARSRLLAYDEKFFRLWLDRAESFMRRKEAVCPTPDWPKFERLANRYDRVVTRLLELPTGFIHGEFFPSNIIVRDTKRGRHICPVDWELAAIGPGLIDLAALTSGEWKDADKQQMVLAYREALEPAKGWPPSLAELTEAVECCQIHLSVQMLGWAADWSPPETHTHDWLGAAVRLADKLGI